MRGFYELLWLWKLLGIGLAAAAVCVTGTLLLGRAAKRKPRKAVVAVIGIAAFLLAAAVLLVLARTPMPIG